MKQNNIDYNYYCMEILWTSRQLLILSTGIIFGKLSVIMACHVNTFELYRHSLMELSVLLDKMVNCQNGLK